MERSSRWLLIALLTLVATALVATWRAGSSDGDSDPAAGSASASVDVDDLSTLDVEALRTLARSDADCAKATVVWWEVIARDGEDLEAYRSIAECRSGDRMDEALLRTREAFEESRVLAVVPAVLDELHVRDLVPILDRVRTKDDQDLLELVFVGQALRRMGDPAGAIAAFREAVSLDPDNTELRFELGYALVAQGEVSAARAAFRRGIASEGVGPQLTRLYALSVAFPLLFLMLMASPVGGAVVIAMRRPQMVGFLERSLDLPAETVQAVTAIVVGGAVAILSLRFFQLADRVAFLLLAGCGCVAWGWLVLSPLRGPIARVVGTVSLIAQGRIDPQLHRLTTAQRFVLLLLTLLGMVFLVPLVSDFDLRLALLFLGGMLLFSTVGSLLLAMLEESASLQVTLRWLAVAGTLPFLLFFLNVERHDVLTDLRAVGYLTPALRERILGYLVVWVIGLGLALMLSRILSKSILQPLGGILATVEAVRSGDYRARTAVRRRDEVGVLADAIDEMAAGLQQREEIKQTFRRYVDAEVAERLMKSDALVTRGRQVHATVLFSDVRGFTNFSESLEPAAVVELLNDYFARMAPIVQRWGGVVDKFLGDGLLAVWDVPEPRRDGPLAGVPGERLALEAAVDMLAALEEFNVELTRRGVPTVAIGIGINAGQLIAGPVGSPDRLEYTVIGDTVNTAQRVESVARGDTPLLLTAAVASVVDHVAELQRRDPVRVKGKADELVLYAVLGMRERMERPEAG